jgi:hypothetical protein
VHKRSEEMVAAEESGLGFNLGPLFIVATVKGGGDLTVRFSPPEILGICCLK